MNKELKFDEKEFKTIKADSKYFFNKIYKYNGALQDWTKNLVICNFFS